MRNGLMMMCMVLGWEVRRFLLLFECEYPGGLKLGSFYNVFLGGRPSRHTSDSSSGWS